MDKQRVYGGSVSGASVMASATTLLGRIMANRDKTTCLSLLVGFVCHCCKTEYEIRRYNMIVGPALVYENRALISIHVDFKTF